MVIYDYERESMRTAIPLLPLFCLSFFVIVTSSACGTDPVSFTIDEAALAGCRGPLEPECAVCTEQDGAWCRSRFASPCRGCPEDSYTGSVQASGPCPDDGSRCAQCTSDEEATLKALAAEPECDCEDVEVGSKPCDESSCACFCKELRRLLAECAVSP